MISEIYTSKAVTKNAQKESLGLVSITKILGPKPPYAGR